jgi:adenosylcobalamin-dependent ribonucleoside-triphosphate reductase
VDSTLIVDVMNHIGACVAAGGIRRSAQIALGDADDAAFCDLKLDPAQVQSHRFASNNSVLAEVGMDYRALAQRSARNGEPGYFWLENARRHGRMLDAPDFADLRALGTNPCGEQTLWDRELCCLVETYPAHHASFEDYARTLRIAFEYAKTVTLVSTHDPDTNAVLLRNRRTGCSMSGVVQAIDRHGYRAFLGWCDRGYRLLRAQDRELSDRLGVPRSIKLTSVKPSGTVSLLAGATPGVHFDPAPWYLRRIRIGARSPLVDACREAGYAVEADAYTPGTAVIAFPVHVPHLSRGAAQVPLQEKLDLAAQLQRFWADNQVSCTADFDAEREAEALPRLLSAYEDRLKGISLLPRGRHGYAQPPYEDISREAYESLVVSLRPIRAAPETEGLDEVSCDGDVCAGRPL